MTVHFANTLHKPFFSLQAPAFHTAAKPITLVLLPGMDGTGVLFEPFVAALGHGLSVAVVRYPTSGDSQTYACLRDLAARALPPEGPLLLLDSPAPSPSRWPRPIRTVWSASFCAARLFATQDRASVGSAG